MQSISCAPNKILFCLLIDTCYAYFTISLYSIAYSWHKGADYRNERLSNASTATVPTTSTTVITTIIATTTATTININPMSIWC